MLPDEIEKSRANVKTDAYQMSVGEIVNLYKERELIINPDFQRLFRWETDQKSKLIESLLLGIPIPSIFVFETEESKWELIDGLQRIATILEFMGLLRHPDTGSLLPPSVLTGTRYLPSLSNLVWQRSKAIEEPSIDDQNELEKPLQLAIRRARLGVEILKRPSTSNTKYDPFQRLNAGGTQANAQELRNCITIMVNKPFFEMVKRLADLDGFRRLISVTEDQLERQRHMELATRFLVHTFLPYDGRLDVEEFIDEGVIELASQGPKKKIIDSFSGTFDLLLESCGKDALRRWDGTRFAGRVGLVAFECIAVGVARNLGAIRSREKPAVFVSRKIKSFWSQPQVQSFLSPGLRGTVRIQRTVPFGENWFAP